jgi:hypothetical protein
MVGLEEPRGLMFEDADADAERLDRLVKIDGL